MLVLDEKGEPIDNSSDTRDKGFRATKLEAKDMPPPRHNVIYLKPVEATGVGGGKMNSARETPFFYAIQRGNNEAMRELLKAHANPNSVSRDGMPALYYAASLGNLAAVRALLDAGADSNATNGEHATALHSAAQENHVEIMNALLRVQHTNANARTKQGLTPLLAAARRGNINAMRVLLDSGNVDINAQRDDGMSALHLTARNNAVEALQFLLDRGARTDIKNAHGLTAIEVARQSKSTGAVDVLNK